MEMNTEDNLRKMNPPQDKNQSPPVSKEKGSQTLKKVAPSTGNSFIHESADTEDNLKKKIKKIRDIGCCECQCEEGQKQPYNCDVCKTELRVLRAKLKSYAFAKSETLKKVFEVIDNSNCFSLNCNDKGDEGRFYKEKLKKELTQKLKDDLGMKG
jgi:hypothetical protein